MTEFPESNRPAEPSSNQEEAPIKPDHEPVADRPEHGAPEGPTAAEPAPTAVPERGGPAGPPEPPQAPGPREVTVDTNGPAPASEPEAPAATGGTEPAVPDGTSEPSRESAAPPPNSANMTPELEREVADAMSAMDTDDLSELTGGVRVVEPGPEPESVSPGSEMTGTVVGVSGDDVFLEFGAKSQGIVPRSQFGKKEVLGAGRRVDVVVERYDSDAGLLILSRKGALQRATWTNLTVGMLIEGRVTGLNKGGLEVDLKGIRAFMPASQVDVSPMKDISTLIGDTVKCEVIELDRRGKNVLLSRRKVIERERAEEREKLKAELETGQIRHGVVGNITEFGAFVDLGGVDGLIHIRDLSWSNVEKVSDVLSPGQEVEVKVLKIDADRGRISLGLKQVQPDPWADVEDRFPVGTQLKARIVRLAGFGAFAEIDEGVDGLIPISEMGWARIQTASDVVSVGDVIDVVVIRLEPAKRRMALSIKQAQPDPWEGVLETFAAQSLTQGRVTRLTDFGAFVELTPGVEGLIHISELSDRHVKSCREVVEVGQVVEVRVLGVDQENRRISLSMKAVAEAPVEPELEERPRKPKKRKKPLRGGLASHFDW